MRALKAYCAVVRYNGTFNSANNTLIGLRAFATPHFPGDGVIRRSSDEGIKNDGTNDDGRGSIIVSSLGPQIP